MKTTTKKAPKRLYLLEIVHDPSPHGDGMLKETTYRIFLQKKAAIKWSSEFIKSIKKVAPHKHGSMQRDAHVSLWNDGTTFRVDIWLEPITDEEDVLYWWEHHPEFENKAFPMDADLTKFSL